jgi:aspartyl-tRNA(Asn)/glutamyl-tRNA(Gln) amidotransferase subunit A
MSDAAYRSATDLVEAFRRKDLSPVEVLEAQLARIRKYNDSVNAFTLIDEEGAVRSARASEARWQRAAPKGALDGITVTVKDNLMVAGYPFRRGSLTTPETAVKESAPIVARCQEAGAVIVGLTAMPEFGMGPVTISPLTGVTRNPWDLGKQAGGSSGGSAAGVCAGFSTLSLASDAGGSIRIPAALTGVVGLKPSGGRVPMYPASSAGALSCNGPIARSVPDAALVLNLASRPDARDPGALPADGTDYLASLPGAVKGWRIAMSLTLGYARKLHPELAAAVRRAAEGFASLGAVVDEKDPGIEDPIDAYLVLLRAGFRYAMRNLTPDQKRRLAPAQQEILSGPDTTLHEYLAAQEHCQALARRLHAFHGEYDLLITPTVAWPAFSAERSYPEAFEPFPNRRTWVPFASLFNLTQQPAISVPTGLTSEGLPAGLHIVGPRGAETKVLRAAAAFESAFPFKQRPSFERKD